MLSFFKTFQNLVTVQEITLSFVFELKKGFCIEVYTSGHYNILVRSEKVICIPSGNSSGQDREFVKRFIPFLVSKQIFHGRFRVGILCY